MNRLFSKSNISHLGLTAMMGLAALYSTFNSTTAAAAESRVVLVGADETPPATTSATGTGTITVNDDKSVAGSVTTRGVDGTVAHIHLGAIGQSGPVVIALVKSGDGVWAVPLGAKLTDSQYSSYKAGNLYVNVHSEKYKAGEIRGQITP
jgi:hypothetical protein